MENFTNETIDTTQLPKFEEVQFTVLQPNYWKVILISLVSFLFNSWVRSWSCFDFLLNQNCLRILY